ncbi:hypothetical protein BKA80DRAFT_270598 [Phyllosticta citrichinensis]
MGQTIVLHGIRVFRSRARRSKALVVREDKKSSWSSAKGEIRGMAEQRVKKEGHGLTVARTHAHTTSSTE